MPNQRKKGKTRIAVWLTQAQREALNRMIDSGIAKDMSDFVIKAIEAERKKEKKHED
jgi:Arc/MetJ-type ribon-helix-helix transcriptional regulator